MRRSGTTALLETPSAAFNAIEPARLSARVRQLFDERLDCIKRERFQIEPGRPLRTHHGVQDEISPPQA